MFNQLTTKTFPDGMSYKEWVTTNSSDIVASIRSFDELMQLSQYIQVKKRFCKDINLTLHYVIGSRMDRPINVFSPNTLKAVCDVINTWGVNVRVVWPHSPSLVDRLEAKTLVELEAGFIHAGLRNLLNVHAQDAKPYDKFGMCLPDAGATKRYWNDHHDLLTFDREVVECGKHRDMTTGQLSGFTCPHEVPEHCVIVDDLCDGGGTFSGLAKELRKSGAKRVDLLVYHGIFSKGFNLDGIDRIYTSNSYLGDVKCPKYVSIKKVI